MRKKKLYYLPGVISIIGLPVLLFFGGPPDPVHQNAIQLSLPSGNYSPIGSEVFTEAAVYREISHKKLVTLHVNDMVWNEQSAYIFEQKFNFIARQIESLQFTNDTASVLKISFGSTNRFSNLVWVLNQAVIYDCRRYAIMGNDLYLFPNAPVQPRYASIDLPALPTPRGWSGLGAKWRLAKFRLAHLFQHQQQNKWLAAGFFLLIVVPAIIKMRRHTAGELSISFS